MNRDDERADLLACATDARDEVAFRRRLDLLRRWISHLRGVGRAVDAFDGRADAADQQYLSNPMTAARALDRLGRDLAGERADAPAPR